MDWPAVLSIALSVAAPLTAGIHGFLKLMLARDAQKHEQAIAKRQQEHGITKEYLDRVLDVSTPLVVRQQLLRFLEVPEGPKQLSDWAKNELSRLARVSAELTQAVVDADAKLRDAKTQAELRQAEVAFREAVIEMEQLKGGPLAVSPEAIRAGLFSGRDLHGLHMPSANLRRADLNGSDLSHANLNGSDLYGADLRDANLRGASLVGTDLRQSKLQRADFTGADLRSCRLTGAWTTHTRFNGADLSGAAFVADEFSPRGAFYDDSTLLPGKLNPASVDWVKATLTTQRLDQEARKSAKAASLVQRWEELDGASGPRSEGHDATAYDGDPLPPVVPSTSGRGG